MTTVAVRIAGLAPLMQRRFPRGEQPASLGLDPASEAEASLYRGEDGAVYQPAVHIESALKEAAAQLALPTRGTVFVQPDQIPHEQQRYVVDSRRVKENGGWRMRHRARFDVWALSFEVVILEAGLSADALRRLLDHAGRFVGIGEHRPRYGRFAVTAWSVSGLGCPGGELDKAVASRNP